MSSKFQHRTGSYYNTWFLDPEPLKDPFIIIKEANDPSYCLYYLSQKVIDSRHLVNKFSTLETAQAAYLVLTSSNWSPSK